MLLKCEYNPLSFLITRASLKLQELGITHKIEDFTLKFGKKTLNIDKLLRLSLILLETVRSNMGSVSTLKKKMIGKYCVKNRPLRETRRRLKSSKSKMNSSP